MYMQVYDQIISDCGDIVNWVTLYCMYTVYCTYVLYMERPHSLILLRFQFKVCCLKVACLIVSGKVCSKGLERGPQFILAIMRLTHHFNYIKLFKLCPESKNTENYA